jgi:cyclopropane fatty-acyl-phospholipid synthase-like methyltransferase
MKILLLVIGVIMIIFYMSTRENFSEVKFGKEGYKVITLDERKKHGEKQTTFGSVSYKGLKQIIDIFLKVHKTTKDKVLLDLGSGDGRIQIWASKWDFKSCEGVELLKSRHDLSMSKRDELSKSRKARVKLSEGNLLEYPVSHGDIIYISSLCFDKELLKKLSEKLVKECKYGVHIYSNRALEHPQLKQLSILTIKQTWINPGASMHMYIKVPENFKNEDLDSRVFEPDTFDYDKFDRENFK